MRKIEQLPEGKKIFDLYCWSEVLQETGDGGKVVICQPKDPSRPAHHHAQGSRSTTPRAEAENNEVSYVLKMRSKESLIKAREEEPFRDIQSRLLNLPAHPNIVPYLEVLEDERFYYIVQEKARGGSLFASLLKDYQDGVVPEPAVKRLVRDTLEALSHAHVNGLLHRDVKPDNLVVRKPKGCKGVRKVALIDWDHAEPAWTPGGAERGEDGYFGTVSFCAPEALLGRFSEASDLYSVGATLYLLMSGKCPYPDKIFDNMHTASTRDRASEVAAVARMQSFSVDWKCDPWMELVDCKEFCQQLLAFFPECRFRSAREALSHRWLKDG